MINFSEKRDYTRMNVFCEIECKSKKEKKSYQSWSVSLSGSGMSFLSEHQFSVGEDVKVTIPAKNTKGKTITFVVKVVRSAVRENNFFESSATLNKMKDNDFVALSYRVNG
ncbi:MAG: hypothetical protein GQ569_03435 [Methylococcaceae bacterium]|nr:hypothetical protein [Methylococcaceae bacterium]